MRSCRAACRRGAAAFFQASRAVHSGLVREVLLADAERLAAGANELAERVVLGGAGVGQEGGNLPDLARCRHGIYPVLEDNGLPGTGCSGPVSRCHTCTQCIWSALILL